MSESAAVPSEFVGVDLSGATFCKARLNDARFRMADLSGAVLRDVSLVGAEIDGEIDGLVVNGVEVGPLIAAELARREPARALARSDDPIDLRAAWDALEHSWAATYDRVAALPADAVTVSVDDEWSFVDTLRHLVFATDAWLGAIQGIESPFHPAGLPFSGIEEFVPAQDLGIDAGVTPSYDDVLALRAERYARVSQLLSDISADQLAGGCGGPAWEGDARFTVLRCLRVIIDEECEHHRFAERDLAVIEGRSG